MSAKVEEDRRSGRETLCCLIVDEMAIRKHIQWNGKKFVDHVDPGTELEDNSLPAAKEA